MFVLRLHRLLFQCEFGVKTYHGLLSLLADVTKSQIASISAASQLPQESPFSTPVRKIPSIPLLESGESTPRPPLYFSKPVSPRSRSTPNRSGTSATPVANTPLSLTPVEAPASSSAGYYYLLVIVL
jgi:hypothetical protein